jgi:hypothetical protein
VAALPLADLVDRAGYCVRMMRLGRDLADNLPNDHDRRVVGRVVLVFVPLYVGEAFALLRRSGLPDKTRLPLRAAVKEIRTDFDEFHDRIRHDLAAHRDDLDLDVAIEAWNEIDDDTLGWFVTAAQQSFANIVDAHPLIRGQLKPFAEDDADLTRRIREATSEPDGRARFSTDALALTRGDMSIIPAHPVQSRVSVLMSIVDTMGVCARLSEAIGHDIGCGLLLKTLFIMDATNLIDGIYGTEVGAVDARSPSLLKIMERDGFGGATILRATVAHVDRDAVRELRSARNKACAHLDPGLRLRAIIDKVVDLDNDVIIRRAAAPAWRAVEDACAADMTTRWLLMDQTPLSDLRPVETPGVRRYRGDERA